MEGGILVVFGFAGLVGHLARRLLRGEKCWRFLAGVAAGVLALAVPVVLHLERQHQQTGSWSLTRKTSLTVLVKRLTSLTEMGPTQPGGEAAGSKKAFLVESLQRMTRAVYAPLIPFLILGFAATRRLGGSWRALWPLAAIAAASVVPPILVYASNREHHPSHRYFLTSVILLLPWGAAGMAWLIQLLRRRFQYRWLQTAVILLLAALFLAKSLRPRRTEETSYLEAGHWLREQSAARSLRIASSSEKISYYGGCIHRAIPIIPRSTWWKYLPEKESPLSIVPTTTQVDATWEVSDEKGDGLVVPGTVRDTFDTCRLLRADFLVVDREHLRFLHPKYREFIDRLGYEPAATFPAKPDPRKVTVWIYRWKPLPPTTIDRK
jgi:hypothetical protein